MDGNQGIYETLWTPANDGDKLRPARLNSDGFQPSMTMVNPACNANISGPISHLSDKAV